MKTFLVILMFFCISRCECRFEDESKHTHGNLTKHAVITLDVELACGTLVVAPTSKGSRRRAASDERRKEKEEVVEEVQELHSVFASLLVELVMCLCFNTYGASHRLSRFTNTKRWTQEPYDGSCGSSEKESQLFRAIKNNNNNNLHFLSWRHRGPVAGGRRG